MRPQSKQVPWVDEQAFLLAPHLSHSYSRTVTHSHVAPGSKNTPWGVFSFLNSIPKDCSGVTGGASFYEMGEDKTVIGKQENCYFSIGTISRYTDWVGLSKAFPHPFFPETMAFKCF